MINLVAACDVTEVAPHDFVAEASDFGWRVGYFPDAIRTTLGNGLDFINPTSDVVEGDLVSIKYVQANGCATLTIFND